MSHTPGPWRVSEPPNALQVIRADSIPVCSLDYDGSSSGDASDEEGESNALLIAAAPELLSALEKMLTDFPECGCCPECPDAPAVTCSACMARAAVAKATGQ